MAFLYIVFFVLDYCKILIGYGLLAFRIILFCSYILIFNRTVSHCLNGFLCGIDNMAMLKHAFAFGDDALAASYFINQICVLICIFSLVTVICTSLHLVSMDHQIV